MQDHENNDDNFYDQDSVFVIDPRDGHTVTRAEFAAAISHDLEVTIDHLIHIREGFEADPDARVVLPELAHVRTMHVDMMGASLMALLQHDMKEQQIKAEADTFAAQIPDSL